MGRHNVYIEHLHDIGSSVIQYNVNHNLGSPITGYRRLIISPSDPNNEQVQEFFEQNFPRLYPASGFIENIDNNNCVVYMKDCSTHPLGVALSLFTD